MTVQDMEILCALNHNTSLTKIASTFFLTQPAITRRIQNLEQELQLTILNRSNKGVSLTPEGSYFAAQLDHILDLLGKAKQHAMDISQNQSGHIKLATASSYCQFILPELLKRFTALYPNIQLDIQSMMSHRVLKLVQNDKVDFGIVCGDFSFHAVKKLLSVNECYLYYNRPFEIEELPSIPMITYPLSASSQSLFDDWWYEYFSAPPKVGLSVSNLSISYEMVRHGLGYSIVLTQGLDIDESGIYKKKMIRKGGASVTRNTWLIYNDGGKLNPAAECFIRLFYV